MGMYFDRDVPDNAHAFIGQCMAGPGVAAVAYPPGGGWVVVSSDGIYHAEGIPQECFTTLGSFIDDGWAISCIAFPPGGGNSWVIIADRGYFARNIPEECFQQIEAFVAGGSSISCVAFPPSGGNSWAIVADNALYARNIDDYCFQILCNYTQGDRRATQVTFTHGGGWIVYGDQAYWASDIPQECFSQVQAFEDDGWLVGHVAFTPSDGWSVVCNRQISSAPDPLRVFEDRFFEADSGQWQTIYERMAAYGVPGASVAFVQDDAVSWRTSYGLLEEGDPQRVYSGTPFQAASISKPHTSIGIQLLAENGAIGLTDEVARRTNWPVATRACAQPAWADEATIQLVLQHMGGFVGRGNTYPLTACSNFTPGGGGFPGYPNTAGVSLPTLDQILSGTPPADSPAIEITTQPGTFYYSGMGYVVLMRMLQDVTGASFQTWMQENVLAPLDMSDSTFAIDLPAALSRAAIGHDTNSRPIPGLRNRYPESAAAGLYTNAGDLCRTIILLNSGGSGPISQRQARTMLAEQLGVFAGGQPNAPGYFFNHSGENYGFTAIIQGYPNQATGMAVMTNRDNCDGNAEAFYNEVIDALIRVYGIQT